MNTAVGVSGKNILLVEDDPAVRQSIKLLLNIDRHTVTEAANGRQALQLFTGSKYDLVITDYLMPEMLGDELAHELKHLTPSQPILMVTAYLDKLTDAGNAADGVLAKPFGLEELRQAVVRPVKGTTTPLGAAATSLWRGFSPSALVPRAPESANAPDENVQRKPRPAWSPRLEHALPKVEITPRDARQHVDSGTLSLWVQAEVEVLDVSVPSSRRMLQLLTYAYACNLLASSQLTVACGVDPVLRFFCDRSPPFASEITAFRRRHRVDLELALARTLARVITRGGNETSGHTHMNFLEVARERLDIARHLDT
jgi:CheY-like chemotaxis protein